VVAVLHDLNLACRYAHHIIAMKAGTVEAEGPPREVITSDLVERVFGLAAEVISDPLAGTPLIVPVPRDKRHYP
jgi:iron complex transport system ATP-binding protein